MTAVPEVDFSPVSIPGVFVSLEGTAKTRYSRCLISCFVVAILFFSSVVHSDNHSSIQSVAAANETIDDILILADEYCGSWPIAHPLIDSCEYPKLKREFLDLVRKIRPRMLQQCLQCQEDRCTPKQFSDSQWPQKLNCPRFFLTPKRIAPVSSVRSRNVPMMARYSFQISKRGKVRNIKILSFESELTERKIINMIKEGAKDTEFEPLVINNQHYEIVDITARFVMK